MPLTEISDLDDLAIPFDSRATETEIDAAITIPDNYNPNFSYNFTITGLEESDTVSFRQSANLYFSGGTLFADYPNYSSAIGQMVSSGPGTFTFLVNAFVLRPFLESALEALVFSTTDERASSTRQLGYSLTNYFDPMNGSYGTVNLTLEAAAPDAPATLADLVATAVFNPDSFAYGGQRLASDVTVTLDAGFDTTGTVLSVTGLVQGDTINLRLQGAGSPFTFTQDPTLPDGAWRLFINGDEIGIITFGYDTGTEQSHFQVEFTASVSAATIEAVIENVQFFSTTDSGSRTLSLALTAQGETEPMVSQDIAVSMVPEIGGVADAIWIDTANQNGPLLRMTDVPAGDYSGGKLTISGLIGNVDVPGIADGSMFSMQDPAQTQGSTYNVYWYSSHFATITIPNYHDTGDLVVDFVMSGTGSSLVESFMNELRFKTVGLGFGATRDLTFSVETVQDGITAQSKAQLTYGQPVLSDLDSPAGKVQAGAASVVLDDDVTVTLPAGVTLADARIEVTGLAAGDSVGLSDAGPFRVDGAGNLILTSGFEEVTIGTFAAGSASYDADTGQLNSSPAVIELNEDAPSWVLEAIIENLNLASTGRISTDHRTLNVSVYNANDQLWTSAAMNVDVAGNPIDGLKQIHYNQSHGDIFNAPFVDTSVSLAPGNYTGWTLEVSAANAQLGDLLWIGQNQNALRYYELTSQPDQSITLFRVNEFGQPFAVASYTGLANQNGIGFGFRLQVAHDSTWDAMMLEDLIGSVTMVAGGPEGSTSLVTYKLSNPQGVFYEDTVQVVKTGAVPGLDGLVASLTVNAAVMALDGPALIDGDVTVPGTFASGLLAITVSGHDAGDVLGVRSFETPAVGQLGLTSGGMLYRQIEGDVELLGYVSGGSDTPLRIEFLVGVTAAQVEAVVEALTFDTTSTVANRELVITLLQNGTAVNRGFVEVNLDRTPLIEGLSRTVQFNAATIAATPMTIDSDVTLPTDISYAGATINIARPYEVRIGIGGEYRVESAGAYDAYVYRGDTVIGYWGVGNVSNYISFGSGATREDVESVMEALTFTSSITDAPLRMTINLTRSTGSSYDMVAQTEITLQPAIGDQTLTGTPDADSLQGAAGNDTIYGLAGDDALWGMDGKDVLSGDDGNDYIEGGADRDLLTGDAGHDTIFGGTGRDGLWGSSGNDQMHGDLGNDQLYGGTGSDGLYGGSGNDRVDGGTHDDLIYGGIGLDTLYGGDGSDAVHGSGGNDLMFGGAGTDGMTGGIGDDTMHGDADDDTMVGGDGNDSLFGDDGADLMRGGLHDDALYGGAGDDRLIAGEGDDTLVGGSRADWMHGGSGADVFVFALDDLGAGLDRIADFVQGEDMILLAADVTDWLELAGGTAADALVWNATSGQLSIDPTAVGLTGDAYVIARFANAAGLVLTADDVVFL